MYTSKKRRIVKDYVYRSNFYKSEYNWMLMKYNMSLHFIDYKYKNWIFFKYMRRFHVNSSLSRINSVCLISGRMHWVIRKFRVSRMTFHQLSDFGLINGVRRSS